MSDIFLHHYDASPFSQRVLKILAIKNLAWQSVTQPMIMPKDDLVALTGGYRGVPVMQIGADIYIDTECIAEELENRFPDPTLFPNGNRGMPLALAFWADAFMDAGLHMAVHELWDQWGKAFWQDRARLFSAMDFDAVKRDFPGACARLRANASLVEAQLYDGRAFLQGANPGMADVQAFCAPWFALTTMPVARRILDPFPHLLAWTDRMVGLGQGRRQDSHMGAAFTAARAVAPEPVDDVDTEDPLRLAEGTMVEVSPTTSERGTVRGQLVTLRPNHVALRREHEKTGEVLVHFPRLGYRVSAV